MKIIYKIYAVIKCEAVDKINEHMEGFTGEADMVTLATEMAEMTTEREKDFTPEEEQGFLKGLVDLFWVGMKEKSTEAEYNYFQEKFEISVKRDRTEA